MRHTWATWGQSRLGTTSRLSAMCLVSIRPCSFPTVCAHSMSGAGPSKAAGGGWPWNALTSSGGKSVAEGDGKVGHQGRLVGRVRGRGAIHMISAWASAHRLVLGQMKVEDKSNEIVAIPELIALLTLKGAIVTVDAIGCQKKIAGAIRSAGAVSPQKYPYHPRDASAWEPPRRSRQFNRSPSTLVRWTDGMMRGRLTPAGPEAFQGTNDRCAQALFSWGSGPASRGWRVDRRLGACGERHRACRNRRRSGR